MARRPNWRAVKRHRSYTASEAGRLLGIATVTVRRWLKSGLPAITDRQPALIIGGDLIDFLAARKPVKQKCMGPQCYCLKCRAPRDPAFKVVEIVPLKSTSGNMRALCSACASVMHKRIRLAVLPSLRSEFGLTVTLACEHIGKHA